MASEPTPPSGTPIDPAERQRASGITLISHSMLFYWWPIWLLGYIMAAVTYFEDTRLVHVPQDSTLQFKSEDETSKTYELTASPNRPMKYLDRAVEATKKPGEGDPFPTHMSQRAWLGPLFCVVLLLNVVITNVPLRGVWSFVVLLLLLVLALIVTIIPSGWDSLLGAVGHLHIYINFAGYMFIATAVFVLWVVSVFIFDTRTYMRVTPGQVAICEHIGASVRNIPGERVEVEKKRDDLFRHWLLGFFSGDLVIKLTDTNEEIRLPNVLWVGWRILPVQQLIREKATTTY